MIRGRKPDLAKRHRAAVLRREGLTLTAIGARLGGISSEAVRQLLRAAGAMPERLPVRCQRCRKAFATAKASTRRTGPAYCLACLHALPDATCGQRLRTCRLAAGLTLRELAERTGINMMTRGRYETGRSQPMFGNVVRLVKVLGVELVMTGKTGDADD